VLSTTLSSAIEDSAGVRAGVAAGDDRRGVRTGVATGVEASDLDDAVRFNNATAL
jgi:hypothetical protein